MPFPVTLSSSRHLAARSFLLSAALLAGCVTPNAARADEPSAAAGASSAAAPAPAFKGEPLVTLRAGDVDVGGMADIPAYYVIDRRLQACWFFISNATPLSCCALRRMPEARRVITWETDESCAASAPVATPAPAAAPTTP